jgi:hypothetical protein
MAVYECEACFDDFTPAGDEQINENILINWSQAG